VKKTSIYLEPKMDEALAKRAAEDGVSKAEFIRQGLAKLVSTPTRPKPTIGAIRSGRGDISENVDRYLGETGSGA
jgi:hypothetical protein